MGVVKQNVLKNKLFPCTLAGMKIKIKTGVNDSEIPLILNKSTIKLVGIKLDLKNVVVTTCRNDIFTDCTTSGHYCIPLNNDKMSQIK